jgi:hypothetical protein
MVFNRSRIQYAHQLEGIDKGWVHSGNIRVASYTDIAPGEYSILDVFPVPLAKSAYKSGIH